MKKLNYCIECSNELHLPTWDAEVRPQVPFWMAHCDTCEKFTEHVPGLGFTHSGIRPCPHCGDVGKCGPAYVLRSKYPCPECEAPLFDAYPCGMFLNEQGLIDDYRGLSVLCCGECGWQAEEFSDEFRLPFRNQPGYDEKGRLNINTKQEKQC